MRIIAGRFKGHRLVHFKQEHIRPTTDRVKESLFNILGASLEDALVLDLFAGTGSLSLEALSRGARCATAVDIDKRSLQVIRRNKELLGLNNEELRIVAGDAVKYLEKGQGHAYDFIIMDPPFPAKVALRAVTAAAHSHLAGPKTRVVIEHSVHEPLPERIDHLRRVDSRDYGDKLLAFYEFTESD